MKLYSHRLSGNCHKVRLLLGFLGLGCEEHLVDFAGGELRTPAFLALNPCGTIPVLSDGDTVMPDSQAILVYLAASYGDDRWLPGDAGSRAMVARWLSFAANEIHHGLNAARLCAKFGMQLDRPAAAALAEKALRILDAQLAQTGWLVGGDVTIADLACAPYAALAPEGDVALDPYPQVRAWLGRIHDRPGFTPMPGWPAAA